MRVFFSEIELQLQSPDLIATPRTYILRENPFLSHLQKNTVKQNGKIYEKDVQCYRPDI